MSSLKKILITLPEGLLEELNKAVAQEGVNRSEFIRRAIKKQLALLNSSKMKEKLKKGYLEMAQVNLSIANMCIEADNEELSAYEEKLAECEK